MAFGWVKSNLLAMLSAMFAFYCDDLAGHNLQDDASEDFDGQEKVAVAKLQAYRAFHPGGYITRPQSSVILPWPEQ